MAAIFKQKSTIYGAFETKLSSGRCDERTLKIA